jgi:hypothetical protein
VWRRGPQPELELKTDSALLRGRLALLWTSQSHSTPDLTERPRDFAAIGRAGRTARDAVWRQDLALLADAVRQSYALQLAEGMAPLPADLPGVLAAEYCGGGSGGYAAFLFTGAGARDTARARRGFRPIEPHVATR